MRMTRSAKLSNSTASWRKVALLLLDVLLVIGCAGLLASVLGVGFLLSNNLPTGGDTASHLLYVWTFVTELLPQGRITAWMPEVFAGFPFLSYYFPLSFISIAGLATVLPFAPAMKIGMFAAALLLPGAVWLGSVYWLRLPRMVAAWGVLVSLAFLLHEQNAIWGGNLLSTLAGEFAYGYGVLFATLALFSWQRVIATGRGWWLAALLEAATGFSHGFALLITGFATTAFLFDRRHAVRNLRLLCLGHGLAFLLLAGWLWPMLQMHDFTIPNDALFEISNWRDLLPRPLQPVLVAGLAAALIQLLMQLFAPARQLYAASPELMRGMRHAIFMASVALLAGVGFVAGSRIGVANIRFFPFVWLFGGLACAWVWGCLLWALARLLPDVSRWGIHLVAAGAALGLCAWISLGVTAAPDWALWNHSGLESKPQWRQLSRLFPVLSGKMDSARLLFEHDPANNDIGSTRALESLPMFLGGRPVLEGLYMESALAGPAIYQLQSEVSARPSSPLARFPSASLNLDQAVDHLRFLYANEVLIRSEASQRLFAADPRFQEVARAEPFRVYRLQAFDTHLVDLVDRPLRWLPRKGWMEASFQWFRSPQRFRSELPVFDDVAPAPIGVAKVQAHIDGIQLERHRLSWRTDAVGVPHLVRMAWHPRWRLASKGSLHLTGPGFMLVIPQEQQVVLEYGDTSVGKAGQVATVLAFLILATLAWRNLRRFRQVRATDASNSTAQPNEGQPWPRDALAWLWPVLLVLAGMGFYQHDPERLYTQAWELMRAQHQAQAAALFDQAFAARKSEAKREEALFWSAKAYELAGRRADALRRYGQLTQQYFGYWRAESLYTQWRLARALGDLPQAQLARQLLMQEFPGGVWTRRLDKDAP